MSRLNNWVKIALGPIAFAAVELFVRPSLGGSGSDLQGGLIEVPAGASALLARHALAATCWIAVWWITEALPIAVTSLLPLALFPILQLGSPAEVSGAYANEIVFLFLGGLLLAQAMERTGLHRRIALAIVGVFGNQPRSLVLGFMVATAALSMWISNTATTVMMIPVALAVLDSREAGPSQSTDRPFAIALLLGIAFAANIGGFGTPIGSPPTIVFQSIYQQKTGDTVSFGEWMLYGVPLIMVMLPTTWWILVRGLPARLEGDVERPVEKSPMTSDERTVAVAFGVAAFLWLTRGGFGPVVGWGTLLERIGIDVRDSTVAIGVVIALFVVSVGRRGKILDWDDASAKLPWGVLILLGAGFAISSAFDRSGLTLWIGQWIAGVGHLGVPDALLFPLLLTAIVIVSIVVTEFASNTASAGILLPVVFGASAALGEEQFPAKLLMIGCALACTAGFAMPAGTPPNALAFATGRIPIQRFVRVGLMVDAVGLILIVLLILLWRGATG